MIKPYNQTTQYGTISLEDREMARLLDAGGPLQESFGIQISADGRIWICIGGVAFLRFKPSIPQA